MKKEFEKIEIEVVEAPTSDVITTSVDSTEPDWLQVF